MKQLKPWTDIWCSSFQDIRHEVTVILGRQETSMIGSKIAPDYSLTRVSRLQQGGGNRVEPTDTLGEGGKGERPGRSRKLGFTGQRTWEKRGTQRSPEMCRSVPSSISRVLISVCVWGNIWGYPKGFEGIVPRAHRGRSECPLLPATLKNLIIHGAPGRVLRRVLPQRR